MAEISKRTDWFLFTLAAILSLGGAMMVYSASAIIANKESGGVSEMAYFNKQIVFVLIGIIAMLIVSRIDYRIFSKPAILFTLLAITVCCLIAVLFFQEINGARRWIRFSGFSLQPSEIAKPVLTMFLAWFLRRNASRIGEIKSTALPALIVLGVITGLVLVEPDLGTSIVLCAIFGVVYFAAGARLLHIGLIGTGMLIAAAAAVLLAPWRFERLMAFLDPFAYRDDSGYQVVQSLFAIGSGGIFGRGFGSGQQKLFYLPYPYSDFIFSVIGEEFGLIGTLTVLILFVLLLWRGARAALRAEDRFGMLLGAGIITGITIQALFNISVVTSLLPAKGIPLPFISYGGTSLVINLICVGILLSISRSGNAQSHYGQNDYYENEKSRKSMQGSFTRTASKTQKKSRVRRAA
ncbi:MAG TPA: putative lipid II flippase FtsW [Pyrinomonadaceae bacterium]|nr:putative lipid II flippase FtsW [Pyrinomonadaceae bacterium]